MAGKLPAALKDIPQSVSVISRQRIEDQHLTTLDDALKQATGVTVIPNDSTQSQFYARGYSLNVTVNGIPSVNGLSGSEQFDLGIYDRVEVLRGPAGLLSGSGDPGGTVNVVTKKPRYQFVFNGSLSTGSWDNNRGEFDVTGPLNDSKSLRGRVVGIAQDQDFFYDKTHSRKGGGYGVLEYDLTPDTTLSLTYVDQEQKVKASSSGLPAYTTGELLDVSRSLNLTPDWTRNNTHTREEVAAVEHRFDDGWTATTTFRHVKQDQSFNDTFVWTGVDPATNTVTFARPRDFDVENTRYALDTYIGGPFSTFGQQHNFLLGYNYDDYTQRTISGRGSSLTPDVNIFDANGVPDPDITATSGSEIRTKQSGVYSQAHLKLFDPVTLVLGGRLSYYKTQHRQVSPSTPDSWEKWEHTANELTPYAGLIYELTPEMSLYGSYSEIFIPQDYQKTDGSILAPRKGEQYETGIKGSFFNGGLNASLATFRINDVNRALTDPDNPDYYVADGEVRSQGWEAEISGGPLEGLDLTAGYTYLSTRYIKTDSGSGNNAFSPAEPRHNFKAWVHYRISGGTLDGFSFGTGVNAVSSYQGVRGNSGDRKQGGYALLGAVVSYPFNDNVTVALNGENLTDRKYYSSIGGINTYNIYGAPRNFTLSVRVQY